MIVPRLTIRGSPLVPSTTSGPEFATTTTSGPKSATTTTSGSGYIPTTEPTSEQATPPSQPATYDLVVQVATDTTQLQASPGLPEILGKGHRTKTPSVLLKDYVTHSILHNNKPSHVLSSPNLGPSKTSSGNTPYPIANYVAGSSFSESHQDFVAAILNSNEPRGYKEEVS